jgi:hypothetical protein
MTFSSRVARGGPATGLGFRVAGCRDGIARSGLAEHPAAIRTAPPTAA